jgi:hypothetical protein
MVFELLTLVDLRLSLEREQQEKCWVDLEDIFDQSFSTFLKPNLFKFLPGILD